MKPVQKDIKLSIEYWNLKVGNTNPKIIWKAKNQLSALNPLQPGCCFFIPPVNTRKHLGFLMFSEGIEKQHPSVMG